MQFETSSRIIRKSLISGARIVVKESNATSKETNLQLYLEPPVEDISLSEFGKMAIGRLKVLRVVEQLKERFAGDNDSMSEALSRELLKLMPIACGMCATDKVAEERRRDLISHFILRLAFCKTPEQTKWFIQQEIDLFRYRFQLESKNRMNIIRFLAANDIGIESLSEMVNDELAEQISNASSVSVQKVRCTNLWKVPFVDAFDFVRKRKVLMRGGFAYVLHDDLVAILCTKLRMTISSAMARARMHLGFIEEEHRLMPLLLKLTDKTYIGKAYDGKGTTKRITGSMIDELCEKSFPLCMRQIHHRLRVDHHLRHGARMQYGLFLKGIGLSLEDALAFWRSEFTKKIDDDKFEKQYAYNIRHNYGKVGRRVDYKAYSCAKIILGNAPGAQDCHGCPFRHSDATVLAQMLEKVGLLKHEIATIVDLSKSSQYDRACTRYFEFTHKMTENSLGTVITHPNEYFDLSTQLIEGTRSSQAVPMHDVSLSTTGQELTSSFLRAEGQDSYDACALLDMEESQ
ncbi:DNA primase large subunit [Toxocara canis]|uniref:DNA primase large subunit n=1 Tax=Toxocara canis TaxID=6265 RepID=A0A0B2V635_TOXCA|nr:DNA primase large subunit [Toxocara canis]